jgi:hypothetical protein
MTRLAVAAGGGRVKPKNGQNGQRVIPICPGWRLSHKNLRLLESLITLEFHNFSGNSFHTGGEGWKSEIG